jgi:hypothetical protein
MKFRVFQSFETLGDPCAEVRPTRDAAENAATRMRYAVARMVADWPVPAEDSRTGVAEECEAWARARELAGSASYGMEAGDYVAGLAVRVEEEEEEDAVPPLPI